MPRATKNEPIGTCECPVKNCDQVVPVYKFRSRSDNPARQRYAGRLYLVCPDHGRSEAQEWILNNADIGDEHRPKETPVPEQKKEQPAKKPDEKKPDPNKEPDDKKGDDDADDGGFGFFRW